MTFDFNSGQFKTWMKKMAPQVDLYLSPNDFLSSVQYGAWKFSNVCLVKVLLIILNA